MTSIRSRQQSFSEVLARRDKSKTDLTQTPEPKLRPLQTASRNGDKRKQVFGLTNHFVRKYSWIGIILVVIWLGGFYYVCQSTDVKSPKLVEIQQLLRRRGGTDVMGMAGGNGIRNQIHPWSSDILDKKTHGAGVGGGGTEYIDMRQLMKTLPVENSHEGVWTQGFDLDPIPLSKSNPLKVFVVPHSHTDPGWLKTFDEYYESQTKHILNSIVESLQEDKRRKFIWAEISFFEKWWNEQTAEMQEIMRQLLYKKQFEFVTGGWVQPDEANTDLYAMEIQLQEGHDFIRETFGKGFIPKYGWTIDPFGFSPTMAYLLKKHGFKGMLIQRVHYAIKKELALHRQLEFLWRQTWDVEGKYDMFTHVMPFFSYDVPHSCGPDPAVCCAFDFARLPNIGVDIDGFSYTKECPWEFKVKPIHEGNIAKRAMVLLDQYRKKASLYRSNVVIAPLGDDFRYRTLAEAQAQFENHQLLFDYLNKNIPGVSIRFGTLSDYFEAVIDTFDPPVLKGSFFTYADHNEDYWSGYYTSRPFDKALGRRLERTLFVAETMGVTKEEMKEVRRELSLFQHHDAITGTARDHVIEDYATRMQNAIQDVEKWMIQSLSSEHSHLGPIQPCWQSPSSRELDVNVCHDSDQVLVYNPLETDQFCGDVRVKGRSVAMGKVPCGVPGLLPNSSIQFHPSTGLMTHPIQEQWMVWSVTDGGAYLFVPGDLHEYQGSDLEVEKGGLVVKTKNWRRTVVERSVPTNFGNAATVIELVYETNLESDNEEWLIRFSADIQNDGVFYTDLNGFHFDTHYHRPDLPIQAQVYPMPFHASIQDSKQRLTVLSDHPQGAASLQDGTIDVWLDRRLAQGDGRGLEQGVQDNVKTRSTLRVLVETDGYDHNQDTEFDSTPLCKQMWNELNHPIVLFGRAHDGMPIIGSKRFQNMSKQSKQQEDHKYQYSIPFVYMVQKRLDYFQRAVDSLRQSDFPRAKVPIIVSHDGHVPEMVQFVESLRSEFQIIQLFHPHSCLEHQHSFPGDDPRLNVGYKGDSYGNPRDAKVCCLKHHFTWMLNQVFGLSSSSLSSSVKDAHGFLFLEEDYLVAPTIYETLQTGFGYLESRQGEYFGLTLDITDNFSNKIPKNRNQWSTKRFVSGPMTMTRPMFDRLQKLANEYCEFDDYNWDWSIVHLMGKGLLPYKTLVPNEPQVLHIGIEGGLHDHHENLELEEAITNGLQPFHTTLSGDPNEVGRLMDFVKVHDQGYGGWGHSADHEHCKKLFHGDDPKPKQYFHL